MKGEAKLLEQIYLLEVLVEKVMLKDRKCERRCSCAHAASHDSSLPLRVRIKFINFPCFEISQEDFGLDREKLRNRHSAGKFKSGKSCMFPMAPLDLLRAIQLYPLAITVFQRTSEDSKANIIGTGRAKLSCEMCEAIQRSVVCTEALPVITDMSGIFPLISTDGLVAGRIKLFTRLTCFGQSIVTQFQLAGDNDYFVFKNSRADSAFQCKQCDMPGDPPCQKYKDVLPITAYMCASQENFMEPARDHIRLATTPEEVAALCECDYYKMKPRPPEVGKGGKGGKGESDEDEVFPPFEDSFEYLEDTPPPWLSELVLTNPPIRYDTTGKLSAAYKGRRPEAILHPPVRYDTTGVLSPAFQDPTKRVWPPHPPIRYDTTSALSPAFNGKPPMRKILQQHPLVRYDTTSGLSALSVLINPPVRYDTTSKLSPAFEGKVPDIRPPKPEEKPDIFSFPWPPHPSVRYDTTSKLSPAFEGKPQRHPTLLPHPPIRYDTTSALSPAHVHPIIRYDTTSSLSPAYLDDLPLRETPSFEAAMAEEGHAIKALPSASPVLAKAAKDKSKQPKPKKMASPAAVPMKFTEQKVSAFSEIPDIDDMVTDEEDNEPKEKKKKKKKKRAPYPCPPITQYPTVRRGHKNCLDPYMLVPKRMGWLWNVAQFGLKYRPGWRPGAVRRDVSHTIEVHQKEAGILVHQEKDVRVRRKRRYNPSLNDDASLRTEDEILPPTLVVHRRKGKFYITMQPSGKEGGEEHGKPVRLCVPGDSKDEMPLSTSSDSSNLDIEFLAPHSFEPSWQNANRKHTETQYYVDPSMVDITENDQQKNEESEEKGKPKTRAGKKKK